MSINIYDISPFKRGSTYIIPVQLFNPDGTFVDLSTYTIASDIKEYAGQTVLVSFTIQNTNAPIGYFELMLSAADSLKLVNDQYKYDVIIYTASVVERVLQGTIYVDPEITTVPVPE